MSGVKSLTAVRGLLNVISYGIVTKADAVLSYFIIGNYLKSGLCNSCWKGGVRLMNLDGKMAYKYIISEHSVKN